MLISIFTPVHKTHKFFDICIDSICAQIYQNWEWVILDNSPDRNIEKYVHEKLDNDYGTSCSNWYKEKIKIFKCLDENKHIGYLKNVAANLCRGEILVEHDYDDILNKYAISVIAQAAELDEQFEFFYTDWMNIQWDPTWTVWETRIGAIVLDKGPLTIENKTQVVNVFSRPYYDYNLLGAEIIPLHTRVWRKDFFHLIDGYNSNLEIADDYDLCMKSFLWGKTCRISFPCVAVNYYGSNTTDEWLKNTEEKKKEFYRIVANIWDKWKEPLKIRCEQGPLVLKRFIPKLI